MKLTIREAVTSMGTLTETEARDTFFNLLGRLEALEYLEKLTADNISLEILNAVNHVKKYEKFRH